MIYWGGKKNEGALKMRSLNFYGYACLFRGRVYSGPWAHEEVKQRLNAFYFSPLRFKKFMMVICTPTMDSKDYISLLLEVSFKQYSASDNGRDGPLQSLLSAQQQC